MKRCSQCDFIYEDDQNLCDMDGSTLFFHPTLQTIPGIAANTPRPAKSPARRLSYAVALAVLVGTLLSVGYSGLTSENVPQTTKAPSANVISPPKTIPEVITPSKSVPDQSPAAPAVMPTPSPSQKPRLEKTRARPVTGSPLAKAAPRLRSTTPTREGVDRTKSNHEKESKIGGFLKKTGKILKRPFKF